MNKKSIELLEKYNFKVLPEFNFIIKESLIKPVAHIVYDEKNNCFGIIALPMQIFGSEDLNYYTQEMSMILDLINQLNYECKKN